MWLFQCPKLIKIYLSGMQSQGSDRNKCYNLSIQYYIVLFLLIFVYSSDSMGQDAGNTYKIKTVVIDPGHGGKDPGAVSKTCYEKDINLAIALKLGKYIESNYKDVKVIYTRSKDEFVEVYKRAVIANDNKADLFISIHVNANKKPDAHGAETFVMGLYKTQGNLEVAMLENAAILKEENYEKQYDGFDPKSPEALIIFNMFQNAYMDQSLQLSALIQDEFRDRVKRVDRGVKQAGFLVLWKTAMPSILIEVGFLSNEDEAKFLVEDENQDKMAAAIFRAFRNYKNQTEGKVSNAGSKIHEVKEPVINETKKDSIKKADQNKNITIIENKENNKKDSSGFQTAAEKLIQNLVPDTGICFRIQITSSSAPLALKKENFKGLEDVDMIQGDGICRYYYSKFLTYAEASSKQKQIKELYPDAFIVAFKNGKKIPVSEAIK